MCTSQTIYVLFAFLEEFFKIIRLNKTSAYLFSFHNFMFMSYFSRKNYVYNTRMEIIQFLHCCKCVCVCLHKTRWKEDEVCSELEEYEKKKNKRKERKKWELHLILHTSSFTWVNIFIQCGAELLNILYVCVFVYI